MDKIAVQIGEHKAWIESVSGRPANPLFGRPEDTISVLVSLEEPVEAISGFMVDLPAKAYTWAEFWGAFNAEAPKHLQEVVAQHVAEREKQRTKDKKDKELAVVADSVKSVIGLD